MKLLNVWVYIFVYLIFRCVMIFEVWIIFCIIVESIYLFSKVVVGKFDIYGNCKKIDVLVWLI